MRVSIGDWLISTYFCNLLDLILDLILELILGLKTNGWLHSRLDRNATFDRRGRRTNLDENLPYNTPLSDSTLLRDVLRVLRSPSREIT